MAKHTICHVEWYSTNLGRTKVFLEGLFSWEANPWSDDHLIFKPPGGVCGGIMNVDKVTPGRSPLIYIEVDEIEPYCDKAKGLGDGVADPKTEIPTDGWYAHLTDPDGNIIGLFQELK